ncbi:MAG: ATP-dependent DNA ligase [Acidimicrobiia bacterium]
MLMAEVVTTSEAVAATPARGAKIAAIAGLLARLDPGEVEPVVAFLAGEPRQGRIGVGWATLVGLAPVPADEAALTVTEVDCGLGEVLTTTGAGSVGARAMLLTDLLGRATAPEADFLRRLLTGGLRQGALEGVMAEAVAKAAGVPAAAVRRACMLCGDLGRTAAVALAEGRPGLDAVGLEVGIPLLPMLASSSPGVAEAVAELGLSSVEWKLDGLRIQVHRSGDDVTVFTRNLNDITARVPEVVAVAREMPAGRFVLDGEALALGDEERPLPFQESMRREERLLARFFDCLHVDGTDLLDAPLSERLEALSAVAGPWRIPGRVTTDPTEGEAVLAEALAAGHEGVVVKAVSSPYEAGRRGKAWRKVKVALTLDLVVLGAEWGHGRRRGWLSNVHLGARGPDGGFVMVGKTFKGMTQKTLEWQTRRFLELETHREGITVFVRPEVVAEIALDGVQASTRYPGGVILRFARLKRYREDKAPAEADTIESVRLLLHRPDAQGEASNGSNGSR